MTHAEAVLRSLRAAMSAGGHGARVPKPVFRVLLLSEVVAMIEALPAHRRALRAAIAAVTGHLVDAQPATRVRVTRLSGEWAVTVVADPARRSVTVLSVAAAAQGALAA